MINWKEFRGRMCQFEVLSLHFPTRTEQNLEKLKKIQDSQTGHLWARPTEQPALKHAP
jgi:hypothetical protein